MSRFADNNLKFIEITNKGDNTMPKPKPNEKESEYISRCVKQVMGEGKTQDQALGQCYGMWRGSKKSEITKTLKNVVKARTVGGFESPEPGALSARGKKILAEVYSKCRKDGKPKKNCARIAWHAVRQAGEKSDTKEKIEKAIKNIEKLIKCDCK